ncbi:Elicitor-responsive protein 3 [Nymphaea thermarum]|nr:Elicitor-responsive protein 3 [Nymphaea thermarum]
MPIGKLEVLLVGAKGLENTDFLCKEKISVVVVLSCFFFPMDQDPGKGTEPEWNETFLFNLSEGVSEISLKIMDSDNLSDDDFVGQASIPLEPLFTEGSVPPAVYNVVKEQRYCGEIKVGLNFIPEIWYRLWFALLEKPRPVPMQMR